MNKTISQAAPRFIPGLAGSETASYRKAAWTGLYHGHIKTNSSNRPNSLVRVPFLTPEIALRAMEILLERYPVLNCKIEDRDGTPWLINRTRPPVMEILNYTKEQEPEIAELAIGNCVWKPIDFSNGPLYRFYIVKFNKNHFYIGLVAHHFIADAVSINILMGDLVKIVYALISRRQIDLLPPAINYTDYLASIQRWVESEKGKELRTASLQRIAIKANLIWSSGDSPEQPEPIHFCFDRQITTSIRELAKNTATSPFTVLLAAQIVFLKEYADSPHIALCVVNDGRGISPLTSVVGNMADRMYVVTETKSQMNFIDVVRRAHNAVLSARRHTFIRDDFIREDLTAAGVSHRAPVFNFRSVHRTSPNKSAFQHNLTVPAPNSIKSKSPQDIYSLAVTDDGFDIGGSIHMHQGDGIRILNAIEGIIEAEN